MRQKTFAPAQTNLGCDARVGAKAGRHFSCCCTTIGWKPPWRQQARACREVDAGAPWPVPATSPYDRRGARAETSMSQKARAIGVNHVALEVGDIDEALTFYGRLFDFVLRGRTETA